MSDGAERLDAVSFEKIWGSHDLEPWFRRPQDKIGEIWFQERDASPLLIKFIFTTEKLSVQVHPNDEQARASGLPAGKTEMWHVLRAGPKACLALGFREPIDKERMRAASLSGEIEHLLDWKPVQAGDTYFVPAGTVHAIGPDLAICEIQQFSDITYRLFDYGRPRPLHLDQGIDVSLGEVYSLPPVRAQGGEACQRLVASEYFVTDAVTMEAGQSLPVESGAWWIVLRGEGKLDGHPYLPGQCYKTFGPCSVEAAVQSSFVVARLPR